MVYFFRKHLDYNFNDTILIRLNIISENILDSERNCFTGIFQERIYRFFSIVRFKFKNLNIFI